MRGNLKSISFRKFTLPPVLSFPLAKIDDFNEFENKFINISVTPWQVQLLPPTING